MSSLWVMVAVLFAGTVGLKAAGPLALGDREPPERALAVIRLLAPALLTGLIVYETFTRNPSGITLDARIAGLAAAALALLARAPIIVVVVAAATVTALARALS